MGALGFVLAGAFAAWALMAREGATVVTVEPSETYVRIEIKSGAENPVDYWTLFRQNIISYSCPDHHRYREIEIEDRVQAAVAGGGHDAGRTSPRCAYCWGGN
jgi:hypothetical protein